MSEFTMILSRLHVAVAVRHLCCIGKTLALSFNTILCNGVYVIGYVLVNPLWRIHAGGWQVLLVWVVAGVLSAHTYRSIFN